MLELLLARLRLTKQAVATFLALLSGLLLNWSIGPFRAGELVLFFIFIYALYKRIRLNSWPTLLFRVKAFRLLGAGLMILILCGLLSDIVSSRDLEHSLRGFARGVILLTDMMGLGMLIAYNWRNLAFVVLGLALGDLYTAFFFPPVRAEGLWKFGYAAPVTYLTFLALGDKRPWLTSLALFGLGVLHLALEYRSLGAICMLVSFLYIVARIPSRVRLFSILPLGALALGMLVYFYGYYNISESRRSEASNQERAALYQAGWDSFVQAPFLGNGSLYSENEAVDRAYRYFAAETGIREGFSEVRKGMSILSQILSAMVDVGLLGAVFFISLIAILIKGARIAMLQEFNYRCIVLFWSLISLYNVFMSPLLATSRFEVAMAGAIGVVLLALFGRGWLSTVKEL